MILEPYMRGFTDEMAKIAMLPAPITKGIASLGLAAMKRPTAAFGLAGAAAGAGVGAIAGGEGNRLSGALGGAAIGGGLGAGASALGAGKAFQKGLGNAVLKQNARTNMYSAGHMRGALNHATGTTMW